jgi:single-strand DNA-binding protein
MLNRVFLHGRLTKDPELRQTTSGIAVVKFSVAVDRPYSKGKEKECDFIECVAWRQTAEFISRYFSKGSAIIIEGQLRNNNYEDKNGAKHYSYTVLVDQVHFAESKKQTGGKVDFEEFEELPDGETPF